MPQPNLNPDQLDRLDDLVDAWEASQSSGSVIDPHIFCVDYPDLKDAFLKEVEALKQTAWMERQAQGDSSNAPELMPGQEIIPGYTLEEHLGSGGFGRVWRAKAPGGFRVALKCVWLGSDRSESELRGLANLTELRHLHLLGMFGYWSTQGWLVVGSELAEGTLADLLANIQKEGPPSLQPNQILGHFHDAAEGLDFLHTLEKPLVHGDIKPSNLLVLGGRCKLGDFGLVRQVTVGSPMLGGGLTVRFAAPEALLGYPLPASDQYSLALTYCHLRGITPFDGSGLGLAKAHLDGQPDLTGLAKAEAEVIAKALSKKSSDRFPNCCAFVTALEEAAKSSNTETTPPKGSSHLPKAAMGIVLMAGLVASTGYIFSGSKPKTEYTEQTNQTNDPGKRVDFQKGDPIHYKLDFAKNNNAKYSLSTIQWTSPVGSNTTTALPAGLSYDHQKAVLTGKMAPGILQINAIASAEGQPDISQQVVVGVREPRALELPFSSELRIIREGDFLAAYETGNATPIFKYVSDWISQADFKAAGKNTRLVIDLAGGNPLPECKCLYAGGNGTSTIVLTGKAPSGPMEILHSWANKGDLKINGKTLAFDSVNAFEISTKTALLECQVPAGNYSVSLESVKAPSDNESIAKVACPDLPALSCHLPNLLRLRGGTSTNIRLLSRQFNSPGSLDITGFGNFEMRGSMDLGGDLDLFANLGMDTANTIISTGGHATLTGLQLVKLGTIKAGREIGIGSAEGPVTVISPGSSIESIGSSITVAVGGQIHLNGTIKANANIDLTSRSSRPESISVIEKAQFFSKNNRILITTNGGAQLAKASLKAQSFVGVDAKANVELGDTVSENQIQIKALETATFLGRLKGKAIDADASSIRFGKGSMLALDINPDSEIKQPALQATRKGSSIEFLEGSEIVIVSVAKNAPANLKDRLVLARTQAGKIIMDKNYLVVRPDWLTNAVIEGEELVLQVNEKKSK